MQATRAKKYKELKGELETADLYLLGRILYERRKNIERIIEHKNDCDLKRAELDARISATEASITESEISRVDLEKELQSLTEQERDISIQIQRLENEMHLLEERKKNLIQSIEGGRQEEDELDVSSSELVRSKEQCLEESRTVESALVALEARLAELEKEQTQKSQQKYQSEQKRDSVNFDKNIISQKLARLHQIIENGEAKERECGEKRDCRVSVDGANCTSKPLPIGGWEFRVVSFNYAASNCFHLEPGQHEIAIEGLSENGTLYVAGVHLSSEDAFYGGPTAPNFPSGGNAFGQAAATGYYKTAQAECDMAYNWGLVPCTYEGGLGCAE